MKKPVGMSPEIVNLIIAHGRSVNPQWNWNKVASCKVVMVEGEKYSNRANAWSYWGDEIYVNRELFDNYYDGSDTLLIQAIAHEAYHIVHHPNIFLFILIALSRKFAPEMFRKHEEAALQFGEWCEKEWRLARILRPHKKVRFWVEKALES